jgi:hypothetical protein
MNTRDGGLIHALILKGAAAFADEIGHIEASRIGAVLENGFLDSLHTAEEREAYYRGCDDRLDAIMRPAIDRPGHERERMAV